MGWSRKRVIAVAGACVFAAAAATFTVARWAGPARDAGAASAAIAPGSGARAVAPGADPASGQASGLQEAGAMGEPVGLNQARQSQLPPRREVDTFGVVPGAPIPIDAAPREAASRPGRGAPSPAAPVAPASRSARADVAGAPVATAPRSGGDLSGGERRQAKQADKAVPEGAAAAEAAAYTEAALAALVERAMLPARGVPSAPAAAGSNPPAGGERVQAMPGGTVDPTSAHMDGPAGARRPIVVSLSRTRRESGGLPPIRFPRWESAPSQIAAKMCIDADGAVTEAKVLSPVSREVRVTIERALSTWRYRPVMEGNDKVPACFATTFRVQVE